MKWQLAYNTFLLCIVNLCIGDVPNKNLKLEVVQVLFRHGMRIPTIYEAKMVGVTDPSFYGEQAFSLMTAEGKNQLFNLGSKLRKKYDGFLGPYKPEDVYALSSNYNRTKESLELVCKGLYPSATKVQKFVSEKEIIKKLTDENLNWTLIPAYAKWDVLFEPCEHKKFYEIFANETTKSEYYQNRLASYKDFFDFVRKNLNVSYESNVKHYSIWVYNGINIHKILNLTLPKWCTDEAHKYARELLELTFDSMSFNTKLKKINGGSMAKKVYENFNRKNDSNEVKKMYLFSGHDLTLAAFVRIHQIESVKIPAFGSAVIMEKYSDDQNLEYVRVLVWDGRNISISRMGQCGEFCPMNEYKMIVQDILPGDKELSLFYE